MPRVSAISLGVFSEATNASSFKNEPGANAFRAREMVNSTAKYLRMNEGVLKMRDNTTRRRQQTFSGPSNIVGLHPQKRVSERAIAAQVSEMVEDVSAEELAEISERNPETTRQWKKATRAPNSSSLLALGKDIPVIGDWIVSELGRDIGPYAALQNPQSFALIIAGLQQIEAMGGVNGAIAGKLIMQLTGGVK